MDEVRLALRFEGSGSLIWSGSREEFMEDNADDVEACDAAASLQPGESVLIGGGAAPLFRLERAL